MANRRVRTSPKGNLSRLRSPEFLRLGAPWIAILVIACCFHFYRGAAIDGVIYLLVALALIADAAGLLAFGPGGRLHRPTLPPRMTLVISAIVLGVPLVITPRYGTTDILIISAIGIGVLIAAWPDSPAADPPATESPAADPRATESSTAEPSTAEPSVSGSPAPESPVDPDMGAPPRGLRTPVLRAATLWACLGIVLCLWELAAYFLARGSPEAEYAFPPLSDLIGPMLDSLIGRTLLVAAWLAGGIALLNRGQSR